MSIPISDLALYGVPNICYTDDGCGNALSTNLCEILISNNGPVNMITNNMPVVTVDIIQFLEGFYEVFATVGDVEYLQCEIDELKEDLKVTINYINNLTLGSLDKSSIKIKC
jgi:hypothetical protein